MDDDSIIRKTEISNAELRFVLPEWSGREARLFAICCECGVLVLEEHARPVLLELYGIASDGCAKLVCRSCWKQLVSGEV